MTQRQSTMERLTKTAAHTLVNSVHEPFIIRVTTRDGFGNAVSYDDIACDNLANVSRYGTLLIVDDDKSRYVTHHIRDCRIRRGTLEYVLQTSYKFR